MNTLYIECAQRALLYKSMRTEKSIDVVVWFFTHDMKNSEVIILD